MERAEWRAERGTPFISSASLQRKGLKGGVKTLKPSVASTPDGSRVIGSRSSSDPSAARHPSTMMLRPIVNPVHRVNYGCTEPSAPSVTTSEMPRASSAPQIQPLNAGRGAWHPWQGEMLADRCFSRIHPRAEERNGHARQRPPIAVLSFAIDSDSAGAEEPGKPFSALRPAALGVGLAPDWIAGLSLPGVTMRRLEVETRLRDRRNVMARGCASRR
jgi:hypothetical protein